MAAFPESWRALGDAAEDMDRAVRAEVEQDLLTLVLKGGDCGEVAAMADMFSVCIVAVLDKVVIVEEPAVLEGLAYPSDARLMNEGGTCRLGECMIPPELGVRRPGEEA